MKKQRDRGRLLWHNATMRVRVILAAAASSILSSPVRATAAGSPFVPVFVDHKTEDRLGPFPYDREVYARALKAARTRGARAVVIKYFLDQPKSEAGDAALEAEMRKIPTFLQARIDEEEKEPNPFPEKFVLRGARRDASAGVAGASGWIPLKRFSSAARGVGFVDLADAAKPLQVPIVERYRGRVVPSLYLSVLRFLFGRGLAVTGGAITLGKRSVRLNAANEFVLPPPAAPARHISLIDLLDGAVPESRLRGKIVVLGYDGKNQPIFQLPAGPLGAHRLFYEVLTGLYDALAPRIGSNVTQ